MSFERQDLGDGAYALVSALLAEQGVLAVFTERTGGVSGGEFRSLNLSYSSGDEPSAIAANRKHVIDALGIPPFALGGQVHGAELIEVDDSSAGAGFEGSEGVLSGHDGLHTLLAGVPIAVATADCVPVILASAREGRVVAVHAGWRGIAAGIIAKAAALFADPDGVCAATGPAAGPCHYEVGEEVVRAIDEAVPGGAVIRREGESVYLDLAGSITRALEASGIGAVEIADLCTIHEDERFFSHRRQGPGGRQMAIAMRRSG